MGRLKWTTFASHDEVFHIARHIYRGQPKGKPHSHAYSELFWYESGQGWHEVDGVRKQSSVGDLIFIRPDDTHALGTQGAHKFTIVNLQFLTSNVARLSRTYGDTIARFWPKEGPPVKLRLHDHQLRALKEMTRDLAGSERTRTVLDRFLLNFLHMLEPGSPANTADPTPAWLSAACKEIKDPAHFYLGTREFARLCKRGPEYVARSTQRYLGRSPSDIVNSARMDYAATQLLMTDTEIVEISLTCGYESLSYFYKLFKKRFGMSPRLYRTSPILKETSP